MGHEEGVALPLVVGGGIDLAGFFDVAAQTHARAAVPGETAVVTGNARFPRGAGISAAREVAAITVLVDAVAADFRRPGVDGGVAVVTVRPAAGPVGVAVAIRIRTIGEGQIHAVAVLVDAVAGYFRGAGEYSGIAVVAIPIGPVAVPVRVHPSSGKGSLPDSLRTVGQRRCGGEG